VFGFIFFQELSGRKVLDLYIAGKGRVGTALSIFFTKQKIPFRIFDDEAIDVSGILFAAVADSDLKNLLVKIRSKNRHLNIIHFSGAVKPGIEKCFLLHPYASITKKTDISEIVFTFWGKKAPVIEKVLSNAGLNFFYAGIHPGSMYHTSAVISGNFTQYFFIAAKELLNKQGFSDTQSSALIKQLILSSIENCEKGGISGITGPAARGDAEIIRNETEALKQKNIEFAKLFYNINKLISKAVKNGTIFN